MSASQEAICSNKSVIKTAMRLIPKRKLSVTLTVSKEISAGRKNENIAV
jgi:hypothetical protein